MHDPTHTEKKAYETYNSPLANPLYWPQKQIIVIVIFQCVFLFVPVVYFLSEGNENYNGVWFLTFYA
jgi:hypothetical protein